MQIPGYIAGAILVMVALNVVTVVAIIMAKVTRTFRESRLKDRREEIEPSLYEFLVIGEVSPVLRQTEDKDFLSSLIVEILAEVQGYEAQRMMKLAGDLGLIERDFERLASRQRWRRAKAAENLGYYGDLDAVGPVSTLLSDRDETVRAVAANALSRLGTEEAAQALAERLVSSSELTGFRMAENLERIGPLAVGPLIDLLKSEKDEERRGQVLAARILGNLRVSEARQALRKAILRRWNTNLRSQATLALGKIGDPEDLPVILEATEDESWPVRVQAANALGMIGDTSSIPTLVKLTADQGWWVRLNASRSLVNMGPEGERALARLLEGPDRFARDRAVAAMEERGVTRRLVGEMTESGERGDASRRVIRALIQAGATRYLEHLSLTLPEEGEREALQKMMAEVAREP